MTCLFCDLAHGGSPISEVYRDELAFAFMDIQPVNPGHVLVVPLAHSTYLSDLDPDVGAHLFKVAHKVAAAVRESSLRAEGINLFLADGEAADQEVLHVHLHVLPRFSDDGFGLRFGSNYKDLPPRPELDSIAARLRALLRDAA